VLEWGRLLRGERRAEDTGGRGTIGMIAWMDDSHTEREGDGARPGGRATGGWDAVKK
jgi:hypothetical protein